MTNLTIYCVGTLKEAYLRDAIAEYTKRLTPFCRVRVLEFKEEKGDARLLAALKSDKGFKIALCVEGVQKSSEELAALVEKGERDGNGSIAFVIGGSDGLCEEVKQECAIRLSFSKMTFPHQLMRVILFEQIYRAYMINSNRTYHK